MNQNNIATILLFVFFVVAFTGQTQSAIQESDSLLENGTFSKWNKNQPVGWTVEIGANNGAAKPESKVKKGEGPSLQLSGNAKTLAWNFVSQSVKTKPGASYRLSCLAKATNIKREGRQFDNCYIGVWFKNRAGKNMGNQTAVIGSEDYEPHSIVFRAPPQSASVDVAVFLSKSGKLNIKDVKFVKLTSKDSFDLLVDEMKANYSYFEHKKIDFPELVQKYRDKANAVVDSQDEFSDVVTDMLAELKDVHTWVVKDGQRLSKFRSGFEPNYHFQVVDGDLSSVKRVGNFGLVGLTPEDFGYVRVSTLSGVEEKSVRRLMSEIEKIFDAPGIIFDLRRNDGGDEPTAAAIASMFADKDYTYARQKFRSGGGFVETSPRTISPRKGKIYERPIVCLIGPGAVSSAEGFAMMMKSLDHCTTIGKPTRGASGNPAAVSLPNGLDVFFSRWMSLNPDGTPIEDVGVKPDIGVEHDVKNAEDPTYQKAKEILKEETGN